MELDASLTKDLVERSKNGVFPSRLHFPTRGARVGQRKAAHQSQSDARGQVLLVRVALEGAEREVVDPPQKVRSESDGRGPVPFEPRSEINVIQNVEAFKGHLIAKAPRTAVSVKSSRIRELADPVIRCRERLHVRRQASTSLVKNVRRRLHQGCTRACLADRPVQMGGVRGGIPHPLAGRGLKLFGYFPRAVRRLCAQLVVPGLHELEALRDVIPGRRSPPRRAGHIVVWRRGFHGSRLREKSFVRPAEVVPAKCRLPGARSLTVCAAQLFVALPHEAECVVVNSGPQPPVAFFRGRADFPFPTRCRLGAQRQPG